MNFQIKSKPKQKTQKELMLEKMEKQIKAMKPEEITNYITKTTSYKTDYEYLFFCENAIEILRYYHL
jgi:hypothetical protein